MINGLKVACIIPARLASSRFPQKMLTSLAGRPLLSWVWDAAVQNSCFDEIHFAVDAPETASLVGSFGAHAFMTPVECNSGTERLSYLAANKIVEADIFVNWQGDEPFITQGMIQELLQGIGKDNADVWTLKKRITDPAELPSRKIAKIVSDSNDYALYFSRSPIPGVRDEESYAKQLELYPFYKHIGLYAFTRAALLRLAALPESFIGDAEKLEQIKFLEHGFKVKLYETKQEVTGIDFPSDLVKAEAFILKNAN